ncbi:MAG TPA: phosphatase PAP2 family protein [Pedobacter sp.]|uniref:phosphatase PAP2 family protein n=1 Tax=Pedobacter sp. TaxID=1411316 RepID=UPI002CF9514E|nr:phosphatase PAP2 family protein [Pedobacter sp.]HMI01906.1 phosphatase PAP2 family protein [Pedobacter sp.]
MRRIICTVFLVICVFRASFGQVVRDSIPVADSIPLKTEHKQKAIAFVVPAVFIGYGVVSLAGNNVIRRLDYTTNNELQEDHPTFALKVDNFTRYAPAVAVYALDFAGVKAKHNLVDRSAMLLMSVVISQASVGGVKSLTHRIRPNGASDDSFPSAHTSFAFMSAEFLYQEYKDQSVWYGIAGYAVATGTGVLRLYNNAHWVSDVVAGAGIGILSTKISYLLYPYLKQKIFRGKSANMMVSPGYQNGSLNFNLIKRF